MVLAGIGGMGDFLVDRKNKEKGWCAMIENIRKMAFIWVYWTFVESRHSTVLPLAHVPYVLFHHIAS